MNTRRSSGLTVLLAAIALPSATLAQEPTKMLTEGERAEQHQKALAASEVRVKAWFAKPDVQALKAKADAGDPAAQVAFGDRIRDDIGTEPWSRARMNSNKLRYYGMAMEQNYGPAFTRFGQIAEVSEGSGENLRIRDRQQALRFFEGGAAAGDRESVYGYLRMATDPKLCSFCEDTSKLSFDREKAASAGIDVSNFDALTKTYRDEKRESIRKAAQFASRGQLRAGDEALYLLTDKLFDGIEVPAGAVDTSALSSTDPSTTNAEKFAAFKASKWLLKPDGNEAKILLSNLSGRGDTRASRKLGDAYLYGKENFSQDHGMYAFYMKRAVEDGSILAAYSYGYELLSGKTLKANHAKGFEYMAKAALAGFGPAELNAGFAYLEGRGVQQNDKFALMMFKRAAENGEIKGAEQAAAMYAAGRGTQSGRAEIPNAAAYERKAETMKALSPMMAELVKESHLGKFK